MMIHFLHPEVCLLAIPLLLLGVQFFRKQKPLLLVLRGLLVALLLCILAAPYRLSEEKGHDFFVLVDKSKSIGASNHKKIEETLEQLSAQLTPEDRVGVISFGRNALIENPPTSHYRYHAASKQVDAEGTNIGQALELALSMGSPSRSSSLFLLSDGEVTGGADPLEVARTARRLATRIDTLLLSRAGNQDLAVDELSTPNHVAQDEQFQFSAFVRSEIAIEAPVKLLRDGKVIVEQVHLFKPGLNRLLFHDRLTSAGVHHYQVEVPLPGDLIPENNRAQGVVQVLGPFRILCVTPDGRDDRFTSSLRATGLQVITSAPETAPLTLDQLDGFRSVVLENVAATDLPAGSLATLRQYVTDRGGGLFLTGGRSAFGLGGYYKSPIEEIAPVSFEIRPEQRKFALAMAIALDNSGSMGVEVPGGIQKMTLANQGAMEAVKLLSPADDVSIMSVDTVPNVMVPLTQVTKPKEIINQIQKIGVGGGGIYVGEALHAAAAQLAKSHITTKHIVLFADAADSEEPGDYKTFIPTLVKAGITISVIGMGKVTDSGGSLLTEIAALGKGRVFFVNNPKDLPRVFAQETIEVAHSSLIEGNINSKPQSALAMLGEGEILSSPFPTVTGYTLVYQKPGASVGLITTDEHKAPFLAYWQHGLGRVSVFLGEVDGNYSGQLATWPAFGTFFAKVVRWTAGNDSQGQVFPEMVRQGHEAVLSVELATEKPNQTELTETLRNTKVKVIGPDGKTQELSLTSTSDRKAEVRFPLTQEGAYYGSLEIVENGKPTVYRLSPVTLSYSPEFEHLQNPKTGENLLKKLSSLTGGTFSPSIAELTKHEKISKGLHSLQFLLLWIAIGLFLLEVLVRRLHLSSPTLPKSLRLFIAKMAHGVKQLFSKKAKSFTSKRSKKPFSNNEPSPSQNIPSAKSSFVQENSSPQSNSSVSNQSGSQKNSSPKEPPPPPVDGVSSALARAKAKQRK